MRRRAQVSEPDRMPAHLATFSEADWPQPSEWWPADWPVTSWQRLVWQRARRRWRRESGAAAARPHSRTLTPGG